MTAKNNKNRGNANPHIKPVELKKKIDRGEDIFILDVRNPEEHESWKVSYDRYQDTPVIPIDDLSSPEILKQIPKDKQIVTFCGHGKRSMTAAKILSEKGYDALSIEGGLDGWNGVYDIASIVDSSFLKIWQVRRVSKGCMSYMIANLSDKKAVVIDATCEIDNNALSPIIKEHDLKITAVIDTHLHADHLSGATRLAQKYRSQVYISSLEAYEIKKSHDEDLNLKVIQEGDMINVGDGIALETIHTPGHTNGSMCFELRVDDATKAADKRYGSEKNNNTSIYLFTGDTLFVNGIGRPDLHNKSEEFTRNLYNSYQQKILNRPDKTLILPAHYSDIFEHNNAIFSTIKSIKEATSLLSTQEDKFVKFVTTNIPPEPMNYKRIISVNRHMTSCDLIEQNDIEAGPNSCGIKA